MRIHIPTALYLSIAILVTGTYAGTASQKRRQNLLFSNTDAWDDRLAVEESRIFGSLASRSDSFDRQKKLIKDALKHVQKVADADEDLQWDDADPAEHEARAHALAEMMGIVETEEEQDSPIGRRKDASEMRAKRCRDVVEAIRGCRTLPCINYAHSRGEGPATFNFPHFFIIGWQKTATTSLFHYLIRHPQINRPWEKEPEFFSETCGYRVPEGCPANATVDYIKRILRATRYTGYDGQFATFEASTHYSRNGHLMAEALRELFPWLKVVASLRDPISRAASMLVHLVDKNIARGGCLGKHNMDLGYCLLKNSQIQGDPSGGPTEYALPLRAWLEAFPRDQIFMMQYEHLTKDNKTERAELVRLKNFLGIDPSLPSGDGLGLANSRKGKINPDGWPMKKEVYQQVVDVVRPDCQAVADMVTKYELGDGKQWMKNWEAVWRRNLDTCDENGDCLIQLS